MKTGVALHEIAVTGESLSVESLPTSVFADRGGLAYNNSRQGIGSIKDFTMHLSKSRGHRSVRFWVCFWGALLVAAQLTQFSVGCQSEEPADPPEERSIGEFRADLKTFMKRSKDDDPQLERNAIYNLCLLHFEVACDSRFESSQQLQGMRAVIAKRLDTYSKDVKKEKLREHRLAAKLAKKSGDGAGSESSDATGDSLVGNEKTDASSDFDAGNDPSQSSTLGKISGTGNENETSDSDAAFASASDTYYTLGTLSGGPGQLFDYAGGRFAPPWDHGEDLVELITTVINPQFWRRNGGPGTIHYYRPSMVLVIRATQQGNEEVGDLLEKLRANAGTQLNLGGVAGAIGN